MIFKEGQTKPIEHTYKINDSYKPQVTKIQLNLLRNDKLRTK